MAAKVKRYYKTKGANAAVDNEDLLIPAGTTVIVQMMDFTAPAQQSAGVKVFAGPSGNPEAVTVCAAQGDKVVNVPPAHGSVDGPMTIRIQLDNSNNASGAFLGVSIYYEEL